MSPTLEQLFQNKTFGDVATPVDHQDIVTALSLALADQKIAVLHMLYPRVDARTHKSLDSLVAALHRHGLHEVGEMIAKETRYLLLKNPVHAWRVFHEISNDSLAIGVHLYYQGLSGVAAEQALNRDAHVPARTPTHGSLHAAVR
jgi:hypothetical protein